MKPSTKKRIAAVCVIVFLFFFMLMEFDRTHSYPHSFINYYFGQYKTQCLLGSYNSLIRGASKLHPIMRKNNGLVPLDAFANHKLLEDNYELIKAEALNIYDTYDLPAFNEVNNIFDRIASDKWKVFILKWYDDPLETNCYQRCPNTCKLLEQMPEVRCAMFSILMPGMHIPPHKGPFTGALRYHLGLSIPKDRKNCYITVNKQNYYWKEGEGVLFDDTYEHEVKNDTNEIRIVLFADIVRPLTIPFSWINNTITNNASFASFVKDINANSEKHINTKLN